MNFFAFFRRAPRTSAEQRAERRARLAAATPDALAHVAEALVEAGLEARPRAELPGLFAVRVPGAPTWVPVQARLVSILDSYVEGRFTPEMAWFGLSLDVPDGHGAELFPARVCARTHRRARGWECLGELPYAQIAARVVKRVSAYAHKGERS